MLMIDMIASHFQRFSSHFASDKGWMALETMETMETLDYENPIGTTLDLGTVQRP